MLAESAAIMDYIIAIYGGGRLAVAAGQPDYADYLYWSHFVNGTLQPAMGRVLMLTRGGLAADNPVLQAMTERLTRAMAMVEARLGEEPYLAGDGVTAADVMMVFTLTTMRYFTPFDLTGYPNILAYLQRIARRPAYRRAMEKGDLGMELLLS